MPDQWYWKHRDDTLGPLETEDIERLFRQRRISNRDQIRLATSDDWLTGAEVKDLFSTKGTITSSAAEAANLLSHSEQLHRDCQDDADEGDGLIGRSLTKLQFAAEDLWQSIKGLGERSRSLLVGWLGLLKFLANKFVILAVVSIGLIFVVTPRINTGVDARNRRALDQLTTAWSKIEALRDRKASTETWQSFRAEAIPSLDSTLQMLTLDAKRDSESLVGFTWPINRTDRQWQLTSLRKSLVQAAQALKNAIKESAELTIGSPSVVIFQKHIEMSCEILDGRFRLHTDRARYKVAKEAVRPAPDNTMLAILTLDGLLLVSGLVYWFRCKK